jgi:hypothetical protein
MSLNTMYHSIITGNVRKKLLDICFDNDFFGYNIGNKSKNEQVRLKQKICTSKETINRKKGQ